MLSPPTKEEVERGEVGHYGIYSPDGVVQCSWCHTDTKTDKVPPLSIRCRGCRRWVRAEIENN